MSDQYRVLVVRGTYTDLDGEEQDVFLSTHAYTDPVLGAALPRLLEGSDPEYRSRVAFTMWGQPSSNATYGTLEIINIDGEFDHWINGVFRDHIWEMRLGDENTPWEDMEVHFRATLDNIVFQGDNRINPVFRNSVDLLKGSVQVNYYDLDTPNPDLRGNPKPMILGIPEHVPTDLYDENHPDGEQYFVADNFNGVRFNTGASGGAKEGLATIPIVTGTPSPGQARLWENGFITASAATLPVTSLFPVGPRKRLIHWLQAHFAEWEEWTEGGPPGEVPAGWSPQGQDDNRWIRRYLDTDSLHVSTSTATADTHLQYPQQVLSAGDYVLRLWFAPVAGFSNRIVTSLAVDASPGSGAGTQFPTGYVGIDVAADTDDAGLVEIPFSVSGNDNSIPRVRFRQHGTDAFFAMASQVRVLRIQILPVIRSGNESSVLSGTMHRLNELVPYILLERGNKEMFDLPPDFEQGPLHPTQIEYSALDDVTNEYPQLRLGWHLQDSTTHEQLLNLMFGTYNAAWRFNREDKFTGANLRSPEFFTGTVPTAAPVWDVGGQKSLLVSGGAPGTYHVDTPDNISVGDLILMFIVHFDEEETASQPIGVSVDGFSWVASFGSADTRNIYVYSRIAESSEPSQYRIQTTTAGGANPSFHLAFVGRILGHDIENPISVINSSVTTGGSSSATELEIARDDSLIIAAGLFESSLGGSWDSFSGTEISTTDLQLANNALVTFTIDTASEGLSESEFVRPTSDNSYILSSAIAINAALPFEADIFSDRFEIEKNTFRVENDNAPGLTTLMSIRKNFRPMGEGEVAESNVSPTLRVRYRREWVQTLSGGNNFELHPMYHKAIHAPPLETMIVSTTNVQEVVRARVRVYNRPRRFWSYTAIGEGGVIFNPGRPGVLTFPRFDLELGKQVILMDVRHLPMSDRNQIIGWG